MKYSSSCQCGKVGVVLSLPHSIERLEPRECDCDFCKSHELIYLSEPDGELSIEAHGALKQLKQGSEQATFWQCTSCNKIVAVTIAFDGQIKGAVNGNLFTKNWRLKNSVTVSPKILSPEKKRERWASAWLNVNFNVG